MTDECGKGGCPLQPGISPRPCSVPPFLRTDVEGDWEAVEEEQDDLGGWRRGDEPAFRSLYRRHTGVLLAILRRLVGADDSEDAVQETWLRASRRVASFDERSSLRTWLVAIAINVARERWRERQRAGNSRLGTPPPVRPTGHLSVDLERAIELLPPGYRAALVLHDVWGHSHREIAEMLSIEEASSRSQLTHARRAVREWLSGADSNTRSRDD